MKTQLIIILIFLGLNATFIRDEYWIILLLLNLLGSLDQVPLALRGGVDILIVKISILTTKTFEIIRLPLVSFPHTRSLPPYHQPCSNIPWRSCFVISDNCLWRLVSGLCQASFPYFLFWLVDWFSQLSLGVFNL